MVYDISPYAGKILFEERSSTFRLYGRNSLYAFRADEGGNLEHLYWGKSIPPQDDLRYLSFSNVQLSFDPGPLTYFEDITAIQDLVSEQLDHENLLREWDNARKQNVATCMFGEAARRENAAWRLMKMQELKTSRAEGEEELREIDDSDGEPNIQEVPAPNYPIKSPHLGPMASFTSPHLGPLHPSLAKAGAFGEGFLPLNAYPPAEEFGLGPQATEDMIPPVGRNTKLLEFADLGTGDYRPPSFCVVYEDGSTICPLTYKGHEIHRGKLPMKFAKGKLPELRGGEEDCNSLVVQMEDRLTGLEFDLVYTVYKDLDAITRRVIVHNPKEKKSNGNSNKPRTPTRLDKLMSATVDFHTMSGLNLITLSGSWANERHQRVQSLVQGRFVSESLRGTSSHQHNPFCAITTTPEELFETHGDVWAFSLVYSGNFIMEAEVTETGRTRINAGINPSTFKWHLPPGDSFESPECVLVYSDSGLEGMSHTFHALYKKYQIPQRWANTVPPILLNTWEAMYFDVNHSKVLELAKVAATCGVEMIVLDDGWFGEREDATSSLGDWDEDRRKFPDGLSALVQDINALGLKFGIWVEPEMVNVKSKLYRKYPTWCLNQHGRNSRCEGRNQLVLDFTREEVCQYVISKLNALLSASNIEYLKWDMNRHLTEVYGNAIMPEKQGEVFHRYMVGVYKVLAFLNDKFPHVRIETCSGGGGRFDAGMLHYCPQIWASDNTDVFSRMAIQHGTSLAYPISSIGSHITAVPNHQTQRLSTLKTRFLVALFGTFGLELDLRRLSPVDLNELSQYTAKYKELAPTVLHGKFYRLWAPSRLSDRHAYAWMCTCENEQEDIAAVVAVFLTKTEPGRYLPRLRLRGLDLASNYVVEEIFPNTSMRNRNTGQLEMTGGMPQWQLGKQSIVMSGAALMNVGVPVRLSYDGDSSAFVLHRHRNPVPASN
ncbi:hypothetical protein GUITHDRAFT_75450 [Guillardia theta CCMP2712]|uniref:alpha-galactosidase n=1 Tax=Guillardia theta (strain CCMP2712) TaxID=905079 RepID=L1IXE8_GUITC|nr:hypothetical protein GUITHDRAFT_75450 [Guillardia theta CCMP2712]EKX40564.1 hypothetical protein GUITHDRAFT_75450 [Guillardia theta CCMP2712]|eukprot:XP_005827544.1 hypothetical protein GUITHDRAFT_75450 [Guillardia theta CCMP2712]